MASIRKRGNSYLLVVSMGYDPEGRRKPQQKTVHPPEGLTPKAKESGWRRRPPSSSVSAKTSP